MKENKKEQFRHEGKYLIGLKEKELLTQRFQSILKLDKHAQNGGYTIRSLYFDEALMRRKKREF